MPISQKKLLIGAAVVAVVLLASYVLYKSRREEYTRTCLEGNCSGFNRSQVDFASAPHENPTWQVRPSSSRQPLQQGPVDLEADMRRLSSNDGVMFQQYRNDWAGCGRDGLDMVENDEKNRSDLVNNGELGKRRLLESEYAPEFGPRGFLNTEAAYSVVGDTENIMYTGESTAYGGSHMN